MENKITFHINNMAYTITVDEKISEEITRYLDLNEALDTRDILAAYIRLAKEFATFKDDLEQLSNKIPKL